MNQISFHSTLFLKITARAVIISYCKIFGKSHTLHLPSKTYNRETYFPTIPTKILTFGALRMILYLFLGLQRQMFYSFFMLRYHINDLWLFSDVNPWQFGESHSFYGCRLVLPYGWHWWIGEFLGTGIITFCQSSSVHVQADFQ